MTVGVLGGGQLGRMLALAGIPLGLSFRFLDPAADATAGAVGSLIVGPYDDPAALRRLAEGLTVATYEFENVPSSVTDFLTATVPTFPPGRALAIAQDRLQEKQFFQSLGIATAKFATVSSADDLESAAATTGFPALLKTRRLGYDGKGQFRVNALADLQPAWESLGPSPCILEAVVDFRREVSWIAVRARQGEMAHYPLIENTHQEGILRLSLAPAEASDRPHLRLAREAAQRVLERLDYVGVLAIEFFDTGDRLLANEMAPRVHNSGHWTIEGAETSQFENHLRAILGLPLGSCAPRGYSAMVNLIGEVPDRAVVLAVPGSHLHLYGKQPRPGRKLGHITVRADDVNVLRDRLRLLADRLQGASGTPWPGLSEA